MGELIHMLERRAVRRRSSPGDRPAFFFDAGCPLSYLAAEHVERRFGDVEWVPVSSAAVRGELTGSEIDALRAHAEEQAAALRLPLVWPDHFGAETPCVLRAASFAAELDAGARFGLAAARLAFCGGFDLDDPETLAEAAAAAAIPLGRCLDAAGDVNRDLALETTAAGLRARGVRELPVLRAGERWFAGRSGWRAASVVLAGGEDGTSQTPPVSCTAIPFPRRAGPGPLAPVC